VELLPVFEDAEDVAYDLFSTVGPTTLATPKDIVPPLIKIRRVYGNSTYLETTPRIEVQCFADTRASASLMARQCQQVLLAAPARGYHGVCIDRAWTESDPIYRDYGVPGLYLYVATYRMEYRRSR
jgi:hypothetical protein